MKPNPKPEQKKINCTKKSTKKITITLTNKNSQNLSWLKWNLNSCRLLPWMIQGFHWS